MLEIAAHHGVKAESVGQHFSKFRKESELVLVRAAGKDKTNLKDPNGDPRKREDSRKKLREINEFLAQHSFNLGYSPELRRIFNNGDLVDFDYNAGGRLYCRDGRNWQTMNKETERPLITIDEEVTAEVDVHASQLSILYALCGEHLDPMHDAYKLPEFERDIVKGAVTIALGQGKLPRQWPKKFREDYAMRPDPTLPGIRKVVDAIVDAHPPMRRLGSEGLGWARLQYEESEAILETILRLQRTFGIPSLPIHDSLIVKSDDKITAMKTLRNVYRERFGISIRVRAVRVTNLD